MAFLLNAEEIGLVHTVINVMKGVGYVCNRCGIVVAYSEESTIGASRTQVAHANY